MKLTQDELVALSDAKDWKRMWEEAIPLVKFAVKRITRARNVAGHHVTDDMIQEAMEAAGAAVRTWSPLYGSFSSWIVTAAKQAVRDHIRSEASGMVGGQRAQAVFKNIDGLELSEGAPHEFRDPAEQIDEDIAREAVSNIRHPDERGAVRAYFGIGQPEQSMADYAKSVGVHRDTATLWLRLGLKNIRQKFGKCL